MSLTKKQVKNSSRAWLLPLALLLAACGSAAPERTPQVVRATDVPTAVPTLADEIQDEWKFGPFAPPAAGWKTHESGRWGVSFHVPTDWIEEETDHLAGADGFAWLEPFDGPGANVSQACEWEANYHRERYGEQPVLMSLPNENTISIASFPCLILATEDTTGSLQSAILLPDPSGSGAVPFLLLQVDTAHASQIAESLSYRLMVQPQPALSGNPYLATPRPEDVPDDLSMQTTQLGELTLEEYAVVDARVDQPGRFEFNQRIPTAVKEKRRDWREKRPSEDRLAPVEVGGRRITVEESSYGGVPVTGGVMYSTAVSVQSDGQEIYRYNMSSGHAGTFPLYYLGNWDERWVLEVNGMLIVNGEIVNQAWDNDEIFGCQELNGRPFYFSVQEGKVHISYDGKILPVAYDYVYHGMCCEPAAFNAGGNDQMIWFYALRNDYWHYVELGIYD